MICINLIDCCTFKDYSTAGWVVMRLWPPDDRQLKTDLKPQRIDGSLFISRHFQTKRIFNLTSPCLMGLTMPRVTAIRNKVSVAWQQHYIHIVRQKQMSLLTCNNNIQMNWAALTRFAMYIVSSPLLVEETQENRNSQQNTRLLTTRLQSFKHRDCAMLKYMV